MRIGPALTVAIGAALIIAVPGMAQAPAPQPTAQDLVTDQIALELGRLAIQNRTLTVSLDVLRKTILDLQGQLAKCQEPPQ